MFRKPAEDDDYSARKVVKAKPIAEKYAKKLGTQFATGKEFVTSSSKTQTQFYGEVMRNEEKSEVLTEDEKNKISAKILKAELKGDSELVKKLKRKLEAGVSSAEEPPTSKSKEVMLMRRDREGNILPASSKKSDRDRHGEGSSRMRREYEKSQDLDDMIKEEKTGTSADQLRLFERSLVKSSKIRRHDDESVDDIAEMQKGRKKTDEKDERKREKQAVKDFRYDKEPRLESNGVSARCLKSCYVK
uniref:Uncharacterized protein n=1 Tax=Caenorhabditis angaria TaxID=860376 RepID=B6VC08_9PELO|nr:hypothetical protein Csp3_JD07.001 [Caenorhabditis angaria]